MQQGASCAAVRCSRAATWQQLCDHCRSGRAVRASFVSPHQPHPALIDLHAPSPFRAARSFKRRFAGLDSLATVETISSQQAAKKAGK